MAPRRSMTYGPGADTCADDAAGKKATTPSTIAATVRGTACPPALLPALRFPPFRPVLAHPHGHCSPRRGGHCSAPTPSAPSHLTIGWLRLTSASEQLRKFSPDRCFFLAELFEPRHGAEPCQPAQLFLIEICHASSTSVALAGGNRLRPPRFLHDANTSACADARRAGGDHRLQTLQITDATGGLDRHFLANNTPHHGPITGGGPARPKAGGCFDVISPGCLRQRARGDLLIVGEQRCLDNHLAERPRLAARRGDRLDIAFDHAQLARFQGTDVD